jgi:hypothetical protein
VAYRAAEAEGKRLALIDEFEFVAFPVETRPEGGSRARRLYTRSAPARRQAESSGAAGRSAGLQATECADGNPAELAPFPTDISGRHRAQ